MNENKELFVTECSHETYKDILRQKYKAYQKLDLNDKFLDSAKKCIVNQNDYLEKGFFTPLILSNDEQSNICLQVHRDKFNDEQFKQFQKEINFLRKLEFSSTRTETFILNYYVEKTKENQEELILMPLFIYEERKTS